ncbi:hypothetical protein ACFSTC_20885 [Nonomuraea ferruginea]
MGPAPLTPRRPGDPVRRVRADRAGQGGPVRPRAAVRRSSAVGRRPLPRRGQGVVAGRPGRAPAQRRPAQRGLRLGGDRGHGQGGDQRVLRDRGGASHWMVEGMLTTEDQIRTALRGFEELGADEVILYCWSPEAGQVARLAGLVDRYGAALT